MLHALGRNEGRARRARRGVGTPRLHQSAMGDAPTSALPLGSVLIIPLPASMYFPGAYSIPAVADLIFKIICALHVVRTGRNTSWIWLIIIFPFGGPLIYFISEMWPDLRAGRGSIKFTLPKSPEKLITELKEELEYSNTVENRMKLARAYVAAKQFDEAVETLSSCLRGAFKDDPLLLFELAETYFEAGQFQLALDLLARLDAVKSKHALAERVILRARAYEGLGQVGLAKEHYEHALVTSTGEEARVRYALLLEKAGDVEAADKLFQETVNHGKRGGGAYRRFNRAWIKTAREQLAKRG